MRLEAEYQEWREKLNNLKSEGMVDFSDCAVTVNFIDNNGKFYHDHIVPIWLEYAELKDDNSRKEVLEYARGFLIGKGDFEAFQVACNELHEKQHK